MAKKSIGYYSFIHLFHNNLNEYSVCNAKLALGMNPANMNSYSTPSIPGIGSGSLYKIKPILLNE